jgi:topoisomerase-4 subunit B
MERYDINSIESLTTLEGFRLRPQMYLGSNDIEGTYQAFKEILNNSTDESLEGYGTNIYVTVNEKTNEVSVLDEGRGVPFGIREDGENVLVSVYTKLHVGGKFNHKNYSNSAGMNGCGGSAVCATSSKFTVVSYKDGKMATAEFVEGVNTSYKEEKTDHINGTYVRFTPDKKVFSLEEIQYSFDRICKEVENSSFFNKKVNFYVTNEETNEKKHYYSENGIADFIKDKVKKPLMKKPIICTAKDEEDEIEIAFIWSSDISQSYVFVNGLFCVEGGSPITGAKTAITTQFKKLSGKEFDPELIRKGLVYAINCKVKNPSFANQTKSKINNPNLRTLASQAFKDGLTMFSKTPDFNAIVEMLNKVQKAEDAADRARKQILETGKEIERNQHKKVFNSDKLKDAKNLGKDSVLLIVEGNSAAGGIANARDYKKYGILAVRGKMLNCIRNNDEKIAQNEEITLLLKAMNIVPGKYDSKKLRYGKIGICTDADSDGQRIMMADEKLFA